MKTRSYNIKIAKAICELREHKKIKALAVSMALGITEGAYYKMESGKSKMSVDQLKMILDCFKMPMWKFFFYADDELLKNLEGEPFLKMVAELLISHHKSGTDTGLSKTELEFIFRKIAEIKGNHSELS